MGQLLEPFRRRWWIGITIGLLGFLVLALEIPSLENASYDLLFLVSPGRDRPLEEVMLIDMNQQCDGPLGASDVWDRIHHARLLERLRHLHAAWVVFDVSFPSNRSPVSDAAFVTQARISGNVIVGAEAVGEWKGNVDRLEVHKLPFPALSNVVDWGWAIGGKPSGEGRQAANRELPVGGVTSASLPAKVYEHFSGDTSFYESMTPRWLHHYGPPVSVFRHLDYCDVVNSTPTDPLEPYLVNWISNRVVFVGSGPVGPDRFDTPFTPRNGRQAPGLELQATAFLNLARGEWLTRFPTWAESVALFAWGVVLTPLTVRRNSRHSAMLGLVMGAAAMGGTYALFSWGNTWFPWLVPLALQLPLAIVLGCFGPSRGVTKEASSAGAVESKPFVPDYELIRPIGHGGYGDVWLGRSVIGSLLAVKIVYRERFNTSEPYDREFRGVEKFTPISRTLEGFVQILHVGCNKDRGYFYYVMELADAVDVEKASCADSYVPRTLASQLHGYPRRGLGFCLEVGISLAGALEQLHARRLIHRDIKPSNIIFVNGRPKFADVGLVTDLASTNRASTRVGTDGYMAPEGPGSAVADLYSLGKVLYEVAMGKDRLEFPDLPTTVLEEPDPLITRLNDILLRVCEMDPSARHRSAGELREDLQSLLAALRAGIPADPPSKLLPPGEPGIP